MNQSTDGLKESLLASEAGGTTRIAGNGERWGMKGELSEQTLLDSY